MTDLLHIPGDLFPDLLAGWCGPVDYLCRPGDTHPLDSLDGWEGASVRDGWLRHPDRGSHVQARDASRLRLPLLRPEVTDHVARVLARHGSPAWHLVDAERIRILTREQVAAAVGWSALSVARGGGVLRGAIVRRSSGLGVGWNEHHAPVQLVVHPGGWEITEGITYSVIAHGPETSPEGRTHADRAALTAGFALLADDSTITFPEIPDAR